MSQLKGSQRLRLSFKVIKEATENFKTCIGEGGYGRVYKGQLLISGELRTVAVKRLNDQFGQGLTEFLTEIDLLGCQKHRNLISLLGYCDEGKEKIIVYEYAERGSLDRYLRYKNGTSYSLSWRKRLRICVDVARGLDHLHNHFGKHQAVIHRDIKSTNILLDHNWVAKVSDFGLSKLSLAGLNRSAVISSPCGSFGYIEPEYRVTGIVKKESDVFSFGMVLLEILCGRLCTIRDDDGLLLSDYYERKMLHTLIDPILRQQMSTDSLIKFLAIASRCLHKDREKRHGMDLVVKDLKALKNQVSLEKRSGAMSSDDLQGWSSKHSFNKLVTRRTNVGIIFATFDLNGDGCLSKEELAAFFYVTKRDEEKLRTCVNEVFSLYEKYIHGKKGLTYHGLLQYFDDGRSNLDSDIVPVMSDSDESRRRKTLLWLNKKLRSDKDGGLNEEIGADRSLYEKPVTCDSLLKMDDDGKSDQLDFDSKVLELMLKPDNDDEAALRSSLQESLVTSKASLTPILLYILSIIMILLIASMLAKREYRWFPLVILLSYFNAFLGKRRMMH